MIKIRGSPLWSTCFLILASTGVRPGQAAAFRWRDWFKDPRGSCSYASVDRLEKSRGSSPKNMALRTIPPLLAGRVNRELSTWRSGTRYPDDDLIFRWEGNNRDTLWLGTVRIFRIAAERAGVAIGDRGAFSWRHSLATDMLGRPDRARAQGDARPSDKNQW